MYRMLYNDNFLFDPFDETRIVSSASITTNVNAASYLDFTIAATHPLYDTIEQRSGTITLYSNDEKLFQGQITSIEMDMDGNKAVTCSSALDWLKDVQLRPYSTDQTECDEYEYKLDKAPDALDAYFQWLIDQYNVQNKDGRYFTIKVNQADDLTNRNIVYFASTSPRSVADAIEEDILNTFGGYLVLRYEDDQLILDLYSDIHEMNEQIIDYGENILDISRSESTDDQYTAVYPTGYTPQYTAEQQKYHDEKDAYDERMKQREETEKAAIEKLKQEEEAEQKRIDGMAKGQAKTNAQNALKRRKEQRQAREKAFSDETKRLQDEQKVKDDKNSADKTKPNPITIESLANGGYEGDLDIFKEGDVVYSVSYVQRYGYKEYVYNESDVEDKNELLKLAVARLKTLMAPVLTIDVRAVDQALYNPKHTHLFAGQAVRVRSKPHNIDEFMMVSSIDLDLIDPAQTTATLGVAYDTLTGQQSSFMKNLNSQITASVDAVDKLGEDIKVTEINLGKVENLANETASNTELVINTVTDYKWMTDTAWGKAEDAQEDADKANQGVTDTNVRIDNLKLATDERIEGMETDISGIRTEIANTKAEVETAKQTAEQIRQEAQTGIEEAKQMAEQIRQDAQAGIDEAKQQVEDARTEANTAIDTVKADLAETEKKAQQAASNASAALGGLSSTNANLNSLAIKVNQNTEQITNVNGEIIGVKDTISGVADTANSALTVASQNTKSIEENSSRIDTAYSDIEGTRTSLNEVKQTADALKVNLETNYLDKSETAKTYASKAELEATSESITTTVSKNYATIATVDALKNIADAAIETWSGQGIPTASNPPASTWTTDELKKQHSGDIYYDMDDGKSYRWGSTDGVVYSWTLIADSDITKAIADAAKAQQTADGAKQDVVNLTNQVQATYATKAELKQTSDAITATVTEVASTANANTDKIGQLQVKSDEISAKVSENTSTIAGHTTSIGQLSMKADGLQAKFEQVSSDVSQALANSEELVFNGGFELGKDGWVTNPMIDDFRELSREYSHSGEYRARFMGLTKEILSTKPIPVTTGRRYRMGIWYRLIWVPSGTNGGIRFQKSADGVNFVDWVNVNLNDWRTAEWIYLSAEGVPDINIKYVRARIAFNQILDLALDDISIRDITDVHNVDVTATTALTRTSELQQSLDGFKTTVSETYLKKDDAASTYSTKSELNQTANEIKATVAEQAETIDGHTTTIGQLTLKADKFETDLSQVSDQTNAISDRTSKLEQNLDGFKTTVSDTYISKSDANKTITDAINDIQVGGTNLSIANGYYNAGGLKNFTYTPADDQYDFDVSAAASTNWGHRMEPKTACTALRRYPWGKWGTVSFDVYSERECTFVSDINNGLADGSGSGNDHDLRSKAQKILPDGSIQPIVGTASTTTHITIPAQQWVRIGMMCYNGNQSANPNHADLWDYSSIGFLSLGEDFHVKVRKIKFEVGNKPTAWSPCPMDMLDKASAETTYTSKSEFAQTTKEIKGTVAEQAATINEHTTTIGQLSLKADKFETDISQTSQQVNGVLDRTSKLEQNLDGFKTTVSNTYISKTDADKNLTDAINDIQIGGTNMLLDTQKFGNANPNNVTAPSLDLRSASQNGSYNQFTYRRVPESNANNNPDGPHYIDIPVKSGGTYTVSFYYRGTADMFVYFYGPANYLKCLTGVASNGQTYTVGNQNGDGVINFAASSEWKRYWITWTLEDNPSKPTIKRLLFRRKGTTGYIDIAGVKLEEGTKATEWSPSPFDTLYASTITSTYATNSKVEQTEQRITSTVEANYATKTALSDEMKKSVKTMELRERQDGNYWQKLGRLTMPQQGKDFHIDYTGGRGYNSQTSQNSQLEIHVRSGNGGGNLFAVTVNRLLNADAYVIKAFAIDSTHIDLYMHSNSQFSTGTMAYYGQYTDFSGAQRIDDITTVEGTELTVYEQTLTTKSYVDQTAESVAIGVVEDYKNGKHGDKLTTSADITVLKEEINQTVQKNYADISEKIELKGSENVVQNPSFEVADFAGWEKHDNWYYTTTGGHTGQNYVVDPINPNANGDELINAGSIKVEFGHTYRVSFWAKSDLADGVYAYLRYQRKINGAWETSMYSLTADMIAVGKDWKQITFDIEPEQKASEIRVRIIGRNNSSSGVAYFAVDDVSLTDYSVAKTINTTMSQIDQKADSISQTVTNNYASLNAAIGAVGKRITGLENPNFDAIEEGSDRLTGWTANGPWTRANLSGYSPVQAGSGTYFTGATSGVADQTIALINDGYITTYPGMKLQISLWAWIDDNVINNNAISIGVIQQNNAITRELVTAETNSWKQYSATVTIPNNVDRVRVRIGFTTTARSAAIRLDSVSVADVTTANVALGKATTAVQDLEGFRQTVSNTYATKDTVNSMQSEWSQTADGFAASIRSNSLSINVTNSGFESGNLDGWKVSGFIPSEVRNDTVLGNATYHFYGETDSSTNHFMENVGTLTARNQDYVKSSARVLVLNSDNNPVSVPVRIGYRAGYNGVPYTNDAATSASGWSVVSATTLVPNDTLCSIYISFVNIRNGYKVYVDDCMLENVTEATKLKNDLETRIAMTSNGVRVGKVVNDKFKGANVLMNADDGSFDILDGDDVKNRFTSESIDMIKGADGYQFSIKPFTRKGGGSVETELKGVNLISQGVFALNAIPATPASITFARPSGEVSIPSNGMCEWNLSNLESLAGIQLNAKTYHDTFYADMDNGNPPSSVIPFTYPVCRVSDTDGSSTASTYAVMILCPATYILQGVWNASKPSSGVACDIEPVRRAWNSSSYVRCGRAYRFSETTDSTGWTTKSGPIWSVNLDAGDRLAFKFTQQYGSGYKIGGGNFVSITRLPFSGRDMRQITN